MMSDFPLPRIKEFVRTVIPFNTLNDKELGNIVSKMEIAFFPREAHIFYIGGPHATSLAIIKSGSVKITQPNDQNKEILVDLRGEGDTFGAVSLLQNNQVLFDITAREDLIIFLLPALIFKELYNNYSSFLCFFSFFLARNLRIIHCRSDNHRIQVSSSNFLGLETALKRSQVLELMTNNVLTCLPQTSIRTAACSMTNQQVGYIVVMEQTGEPVGIVTDTDLRVRALAVGMDPSAPVTEIMSRPIRSISSKVFAFEALLEMIRHRIHYLVVVEGERVVGVISDHDVRVVTGTAPIGIMRDLDKINSLKDLELVHYNLDPVLEMLLRLGGSAQYMLDLAAEFNDRLILKILELTTLEMEQQGLGRAPVAYSWLALGSAGRREQALRNAQHNSLIFMNVPSDNTLTIKKWFLNLAERTIKRLHACGFPLSKHGLQANIPIWCQSEKAWQKFFTDLIQEIDQCALPAAGALFDLRGIHEEMALAESLRLYVSQTIEGNCHFLSRLAQVGTQNRPPLNFLYGLIVEKSGKYHERFHPKINGLTPLITGVRILALEEGLTVTSTLGRLAELNQRGILQKRSSSDLAEAYSYIILLQIKHYLEARATGHKPKTYLKPIDLNQSQRKVLKDSFTVISELQAFLEQRYQSQNNA